MGESARESSKAPSKLGRPRFFPPPETAGPDGVLCWGGSLEPEVLVDAYSHGIFPMPLHERLPVFWFSPDPRAILPLDGLHISRRLRRKLRKQVFTVTCDVAFAEVVHACATVHGRWQNTWITPDMFRAFCRMHSLGYCHSVEVWHEGQLVGGVFGTAVGAYFSADSMFYKVSDASKVALVYLVGHLRKRGYRLLDVQQYSPHVARFGAIEIPRRQFLEQLAVAVSRDVHFGTQLEVDDSLWRCHC